MGFTNDRNAEGFAVVEKLFYLDDDYAEIFTKNGLDSFEAIWDAEADIVDDPNLGRGGHSDVGILRLLDGDGEQCFYLKRQVNHNCKTVKHPFHGIPLAIREWLNIKRLKKAGIETMDVACVGRVCSEDDRALLVTRALDGFQTIGEWLSHKPQDKERQAVMETLGRLIGKMHRSGIKHGCLYAKHIFLATDSPKNIRLIDLEKCKPIWSKRGGPKDLATFFRRTPELSEDDRRLLLGAYADASPVRWVSSSSQSVVIHKIMAAENF